MKTFRETWLLTQNLSFFFHILFCFTILHDDRGAVIYNIIVRFGVNPGVAENGHKQTRKPTNQQEKQNKFKPAN